MVDPDRVRRLITAIQGWRDLLADDSPDVYRRRYAVQAAAQASIDLANHVIASEGWRVPQDYGDAFTVLSEHGVISDRLRERLQRLAGLRNLLVHLYDDIDDDRVADEVRQGLGDLDEFSRAVAGMLRDEPGDR